MNDENDIVQSDDEDREVDHPDRLDLIRKEIQRINYELDRIVKELHQMNRNIVSLAGLLKNKR